jgi:UDP-N-acetylglucosamine--N-acetylmuramyl-(pentapeptide) pyrophosphoryl-undecaprenol N-acetylglucosamine transferase
MSFGGYIALPLAFWAWVFRIPVFTHEQTIRSGSANKYIGFFSHKIFTAFEESVSQFPAAKTRWVGNPVRPIIFEQHPLSFSVDESVPLLYITGGSLGSHSINEHIFHLAPELVKTFTVVHQLGEIKEYGDNETARAVARTLNKAFPHRYVPVSHVVERDLGSLYHRAVFVIGRSGANTFFELLALKKPAIFIPLPWSAHGEQKAHAELYVSYGLGEIFDQKDHADALLKKIYHLYEHRSEYDDNFTHLPLQLKHDATRTIIEEILRA